MWGKQNPANSHGLTIFPAGPGDGAIGGHNTGNGDEIVTFCPSNLYLTYF